MGRIGTFIASSEIDLSGEVGVAVLFVPHRSRRVLRIPQVVLGVGEVDAVRRASSSPVDQTVCLDSYRE